MSTHPKKKKVIKKKVVKKVVKKKKVPSSNAKSTTNGLNRSPPKSSFQNNGHSKVKPIAGMRKMPHRTHRPSIEDAIGKFTTMIQEQTEIIEKLKAENQKLKKEIEVLKNRPPEKIYIRKSVHTNDNSIDSNGSISPRDRGMSRRNIKPKGGPPTRALPGMKSNSNSSLPSLPNSYVFTDALPLRCCAIYIIYYVVFKINHLKIIYV